MPGCSNDTGNIPKTIPLLILVIIVMQVYKISDLLSSLNSASEEGFEYVSLNIIEADDDDPELDYDSLFLDYVDDKSSSEEDIVDSVPLPDDYYRLV